MNKTCTCPEGHYILGKRYVKKLVTKVLHVACEWFKEGVVVYTLAVVRKAICKPETDIHKGTSRQSLRGISCTVDECKLVWPLWRTVWRFLKKLKIENPMIQQLLY